MNVSASRKDLRRPTASEVTVFVRGYSELYKSYLRRHGRRFKHDRTVPLARLRESGLPDYLTRWMLYQDHIEHLRVSKQGIVIPARTSTLLETSVFRLTPNGVSFAGQFLADSGEPMGDGELKKVWDQPLIGPLLPRFETENRLLSWGRHVVKKFARPSRNQELILCSAEELGWPPRFDDPLPPCGGTNPKTRLHDTIKCLNRHQRCPFVRFRGDGTGRQILWELR
jgi:hypothetical protein